MVAACPALAATQNPDVSVKLDARLSYRAVFQGPTSLRGYDLLGNPSTVSLNFSLEPGLTARVTQRFQRPDSDGDNELTLEYYIEDAGIWRLGKQPLPFGGGKLFRDHALAARGDTSFLLDVPISAAAVDGGRGRPTGVVGRIGPTQWGFSAAVGRHFANQAATNALWRGPEEGLGVGGGYRRVFGFDFSQPAGSARLHGEALVLRGGHRGARDDEVYDLSVGWSPSRYQSFGLGATFARRESLTTFRAEGSIWLTDNATFEPALRVRNGQVFDLGLTLRVRL